MKKETISITRGRITLYSFAIFTALIGLVLTSTTLMLLAVMLTIMGQR